MRRIAFVVVAANLAIWAAGSAPAATVSLIGAWQSCKTDRCSERFAFQPNGTVIKQYVVQGTTVTAYGHYKRRRGLLKITWTRFSPKEVCPATNAAGQARCKSSAEPPAQGPIRFEGFNALVWKISPEPIRLVRIEE